MRMFLLLALLLAALPARAQQPVIPNFWDPQERFIKPNLADRRRLRFLTVTDFAPFSYIDARKRLSGFHVDLARMVCEELNLSPVCQIQGIPAQDLADALERGVGDVVLAGLIASPATREKFIHSRAYFRLPARLAVRADGGLATPLGRTGFAGAIDALAGRTVAVTEGTAQAAFARARFGAQTKLRLFATADAAFRALAAGRVDGVFDDGLSLARRLQSGAGDDCCLLAGPPFLAPPYFGQAMTAAVRGDDYDLAEGINFALKAIAADGRFRELYLRYFPVSPY